MVFAVVAASIGAAAFAFLAFNFPPAQGVHGRRGIDSARLSLRRARHPGLARRTLAALVPAARVLAVRRRREPHAGATRAARRAILAGASVALLPAPGAAGLGPPQYRARGVRADGGMRRARAVGARPDACGAVDGGRHCSRCVSRARERRRSRVAPALAAGSRAMLQRINWRASVAFLHDVAAAARGLGARLSPPLQLRAPRAVLRRDAREPRLGRGRCRPGSVCGFGMYRGLWRFASLPDLRRILVAAVLGTMAIAVGVAARAAAPRAAIGVHPLPGAARDDHGREPARLPRVEGGSSQPHRRATAGA